ncbi:MAG: hypothetical protein KDB23_26595, partial [Planctomycetales bacterium]|nr:hypothetical protein [Planctomycetales bacterium]
MNESSHSVSQQDQVRRLVRLATELSVGLAENRTRYEERIHATETQFASASQLIDEQAVESLDQLSGELTQKLAEARVEFEQQVEALEDERGRRSDEILRRRAEVTKQLEDNSDLQESQLRDSAKGDIEQLKKQHEDFLGRAANAAQHLDTTIEHVTRLLHQRSVPLPNGAAVDMHDAQTWSSTWMRRFEKSIETIGGLIQVARRRPAEKFVREGWVALFFLLATPVSAAIIGPLVAYESIRWAGAALVAGTLLSIAAYLLARQRAVSDWSALAPELADELAVARHALIQAQRAEQRELKAGHEEVRTHHEQQLLLCQAEREKQRRQTSETADTQAKELENSFALQHQRFQKQWEQRAHQLRQHYRPLIEQRRAFFAAQREQTLQQREQQTAKAEAEFAEVDENLRATWRRALAGFESFMEVLQNAAPLALAQLSDDTQHGEEWQPSTMPPDIVPIGRYQFQLPESNHELRNEPMPARLPAILSFPAHGSLLLNATDAGRDAAIGVLQNTTLQLLAAFPPGKLRLTIIDPLGLGQNFSAFMHLADYDERLV